MDKPEHRAAERDGRRLALTAVFEADFGQHTATDVVEREIKTQGAVGLSPIVARQIVTAVVAHRDSIDALIGELAPQYPVTQLARIDRALLRSGIAELLHCPTPARVSIAEWVELARTYSGEPARKLTNGVLGRVAAQANSREPDMPDSGN
jgi:transcription antitermination protein NusB